MSTTHSKNLLAPLASRRGATMVEYGILLALILVIAGTAFREIGTKVNTAATSTSGKFN